MLTVYFSEGNKRIHELNNIDTDLLLDNLVFYCIGNVVKIEGFNNLKDFRNLELLSLCCCGINNIEIIKELEYLPLKTIKMSGNMITKTIGLNEFIYLESLFLNNNMIATLEGFDNLIRLEKLELSRNNITEINGLEKLLNLKYLGLSHNKITEIKGLDTLTKMEDLNLDSNLITEIKGLDALTRLENLSLQDNLISEIKGLNNLTILKILNLQINLITEIKGLNHLNILKSLYLQNNNLREIKNLDGFSFPPELNLLDLSYNYIEEIKGLDNLINLEILYLYDNKIREIKGLKSLQKLRSLFVGHIPLRYIKRYAILTPTVDNVVNTIQLLHNSRLNWVDVKVHPIIKRMIDNKNKGDICHIDHEKHSSLIDYICNILSVNFTGDILTEIRNCDLIDGDAANILIEYIKCNDVHPIYNVTFEDVMKSAWNIINFHPHKNELIKKLCEEIACSSCELLESRLHKLIFIVKDII